MNAHLEDVDTSLADGLQIVGLIFLEVLVNNAAEDVHVGWEVDIEVQSSHDFPFLLLNLLTNQLEMVSRWKPYLVNFP